MQRVHQAGSLAEAYLLAGLLEGHGIAVRILNENAHGAMGEIPFVHTWPEVWVLDEHLVERARQLVRRFEQDRLAPPAGSLACRHCGEENPATFEVCWACGAELKL